MKEAHGKIFIIDTSVLMHDPECIERFRDNEIVIPIVVLEELDNLKEQNGKGEMAREVSRRLDEYKKRGALHTGVPTKTGGLLRLEFRAKNLKRLPVGLEKRSDNIILAVAVALNEQERRAGSRKRKVILVSKDINLRLKADACSVAAEDYTSDKLVDFMDKLYHGTTRLEFREERTDILTALHTRKTLPFAYLEQEVAVAAPLHANSCCFLQLPSGKYAQAVFKREPEAHLIHVPPHDRWHTGKIKPRNPEQAFALTLLMDASVPIISLIGKAGTGKTLLALYAAYEQLEKKYDKIMVFRPYVELGKKMGFLPGDIDDKFSPYKQPILDNLFLITAHAERDKGNGWKDSPQGLIAELEEREAFEVSPISFVRGRSLHKQFIIIDEAQNMTPHEIHTLITRVGEGSKVILTGDPTQVDDPFLDAPSCGLVHAIVRLTGQRIFGHLRLKKSERSEVAEVASQLLDPRSGKNA